MESSYGGKKQATNQSVVETPKARNVVAFLAGLGAGTTVYFTQDGTSQQESFTQAPVSAYCRRYPSSPSCDHSSSGGQNSLAFVESIGIPLLFALGAGVLTRVIGDVACRYRATKS